MAAFPIYLSCDSTFHVYFQSYNSDGYPGKPYVFKTVKMGPHTAPEDILRRIFGRVTSCRVVWESAAHGYIVIVEKCAPVVHFMQKGVFRGDSRLRPSPTYFANKC